MSKFVITGPKGTLAKGIEQLGDHLKRWMDGHGDGAIVLEEGWDVKCLQDDDRPLVYLCGTITPDAVHLEWRERAEALLSSKGMGVLSPVRGKDPRDWTLDGMDSARLTPYANGGFVPRDWRDVKKCDAILLWFMAEGEPKRQSIGTWVELGWAQALGKPVVLVTDLAQVAEHPFIWRQVAKVAATLEEGVEYLAFLLAD